MDSSEEYGCSAKKSKSESASVFTSDAYDRSAHPGDSGSHASAARMRDSDDDDDYEYEEQYSPSDTGDYRSPLLRSPRRNSRTRYISREVGSNKVVFVNEETLNHKGKVYTMNDIAPKFKKDCRTWLWKNSKKTKEQYLQDMKDYDAMPSTSGYCKNKSN